MKSQPPFTTIEVRVMPVRTLKPAPYNPREVLKPTDPAYRKLEASLREFGLVEPLVWNELTGHVVGGHARLRILKSLGVKEVPVSVVHLEPAREKALNIVLNNQEAQSRYDSYKLADLLRELEPLPEMKFTGFDRYALPALRMEPLAPIGPDGKVRDNVTVTLEMKPEVFKRVAPRLDELIAEFDLVSHVSK
jgi:ParB-like chromosome segregation protein Spo0J